MPPRIRMALYDYDTGLRARGWVRLAGVDEAGRGPLAGPVVAGAAVLPPEARFPGLNDSKKVPEALRNELFDAIRERAIAWGVGIVEADEIDRINILQATHRACALALDALGFEPDGIVSDYLKLEGRRCPIEAIKKGDATSASVAAASILAKVTRDRIMARMDGEFPEYGFAEHKGYGTAKHQAALAEHGPTTIHRLSFGGVCFFECEPRRSRTCADLLGRLTSGGAGAQDLHASLRQALPQLPRIEQRELQRHLNPA